MLERLVFPEYDERWLVLTELFIVLSPMLELVRKSRLTFSLKVLLSTLAPFSDDFDLLKFALDTGTGLLLKSLFGRNCSPGFLFAAT